MTALYILLAITALFVFLLSRKVRISASYGDGFSFSVGYLFFRYSPKPSAKDEGGKKRLKRRKEPPKEEQKPKEDKQARSPSVKELLSLISEAVKELIKWFGASLYIEKLDLQICIATDDAAKTAILYGAVSPLAAEITQLCLGIRHRKKHDRLISTHCDVNFAEEVSSVKAEAVFAIRLWRLLTLAKAAVKLFLKYKSYTKSSQKK